MIRLALLPQAAFALAAVSTYLVHGALWFGAAWVATRRRVGLDPAAANVLWRAALLGPLLSTALALGISAGWRPAALEIAVVTPPRSLPAEADLPPSDTDEASAPEPLLPPVDPETKRWALGAPTAGSSAETVEGPRPASSAVAIEVAGCVLALAGVARLLALGWRRRRFWRRLRDRQPLTSGPAAERLQALCSRAGLADPVRLSTSPHAPGPMALGRHEICLPSRALEELSGPALSAVLAHELAHLERWDNVWLTLAAVLEALLFFQPLTRRARRALESSAERACDERAVALTGEALALAQSIALVAAWGVGSDEAVPVAPMARSQPEVLGRVRALLDDRPAPVRAGRKRVALVAALACGLLAPAVGEVRGAPAAAASPTAVAPTPPAPAKSSVTPLPVTPAPLSPPSKTMPPAPGPARIPRPPAPPLPAGLPLPLEDMLGNVLEVVPKATTFGREMAGLAADEARLESERAELRSHPEAQRSAADRASLADLDRQIAAARERRQAEEKRIDREMDAWGKQFEQRFGKDFQERMERWGQDFGTRMKDWGNRYGAEMERWGRERAAESLAERGGPGEREGPLRRDEPARRLADEQRRLESSRRRVEEAQHRVQDAQRRLEDAQRRMAEAQSHAAEERRQTEAPRPPAPARAAKPPAPASVASPQSKAPTAPSPSPVPVPPK